jgi:PAS domain S-box-containing protein
MPDEADNLTGQDEAQERLRASEIRYRRLFESARDGILILDVVNQKITDANPSIVEFLGLSRDELLGRELWEIGLFKSQEESHIAFRDLQAIGYLRYEALPVETKAGGRRDVVVVCNVYDEGRDRLFNATFAT